MSVRLFIGYFVALSACATAAFASSWMDTVAAQDTPSANSQPLHSIVAHRHDHQNMLKHVLLAEVR